jgi:hypothetical protein
VVLAREQDLEPLVLEDRASLHTIRGLVGAKAELGIDNLKHTASSPDLDASKTAGLIPEPALDECSVSPPVRIRFGRPLKILECIPQDSVDKWIVESWVGACGGGSQGQSCQVLIPPAVISYSLLSPCQVS